MKFFGVSLDNNKKEIPNITYTTIKSVPTYSKLD